MPTKIKTEHVVAYALSLKRKQNGRLDGLDVKREIAKDIVLGNLNVLGEYLQTADTIVDWTRGEYTHSPPPQALGYDDLGMAVALIDHYDSARLGQVTENSYKSFPLGPGNRGLLVAKVVSITEKDKTSDKVFANGRAWVTTSHIVMEVADPSDHEETWLAIWYATASRERLKPYWDALADGKKLFIVATVRKDDVTGSQTQKLRRLGGREAYKLTLVREASLKQRADWQKRHDRKQAALQTGSNAA